MATGRKIRIGEAASAISTTSKALRHWISRYSGKGLKPTVEQTGTWLEFGWGDVAAFAITKYLVDFGMPAAAAFTYAMAIVEERWPGLFDADNPHWELTSTNAIIDFHFGPSTYFPGQATWGVSAIEGENLASRFKRGLDSVGDEKFPARAIVTLYIGHIIIDAFANLVDMDHKPPRLEQKFESESEVEGMEK
jgi:hypothetical protein